MKIDRDFRVLDTHSFISIGSQLETREVSYDMVSMQQNQD